MTLTLELPDSSEAALKARAAAEGLSAEQYIQQMVDRDLHMSSEIPTEDTRPIWEMIVERMQSVPEHDLAALPNDGASQIDHYLYGSPRKDP